MFDKLKQIYSRPKPFEFYTASDLWTDEHIAQQMLSFHLDGTNDISSRNFAFIERSVDWITSRFKIREGKSIADFGCGPGLYTERLARGQADVTGIDFSKRSLLHAQSVADGEGLAIHYVNQNYLEYETAVRFDLCLMITCDFSALSKEQRRTMLLKFRDVLKPGGHILLDVYSMNAFEDRKEGTTSALSLQNGFWSPHPYYGFLNRFKYQKETLALDKYTLIEKARTRTIYNWFQHFDSGTLKREFSEVGFQVEEYYSDVAGSPFTADAKEFAVVARMDSA